jgi:hypothetical protein
MMGKGGYKIFAQHADKEQWSLYRCTKVIVQFNNRD